MVSALFVLNGSLSDAHELNFPSAPYSSAHLYASGKVSNDTAVFSFRVFSNSGVIITFLNYNNWTAKSFYSRKGLTYNMLNLTELFVT